MNADRGGRFADGAAFDYRTEAIWRRLREGGETSRTSGPGVSISERAGVRQQVVSVIARVGARTSID